MACGGTVPAVDYLKVSETGDAPYHAVDGASVAVNYEHIQLARGKALQAFSRVRLATESDTQRIERLEASVTELSDSVIALVNLLTEVVSGLDQRDVHVVNYPEEQPYLVRPS
jgi:hypothetical protein